MDTYHSRKSAFLPFSCGLFFFKSTLEDEQCSNLSSDDSNPVNHTQNSPKRRQENSLLLVGTLKSQAGDGPAAAGCPVSNPDNNCANGLLVDRCMSYQGIRTEN